ncbi:hypothetical protein ACFL4J_01460 [Candidatus Margulisiibacteriota bacterium]
MRHIALLLIAILLLEIPALAADPQVLKDKLTVWSGLVELQGDVEVPAGSTLVIDPGTRIHCVYDHRDGQFSPAQWQIIIKGDLIASGEVDRAVTIAALPYGLASLRVPVDPTIERISISPQKVDTKRIRDEFSGFRLQYLALWTMLFAGVYFAIKSRNN